jgi:hypothetical protein
MTDVVDERRDMGDVIVSAREAIKKEGRLRRMRLGQDAPEFVNLITNPEIRVALVPLTEAEYHIGLKAAMDLPAADNAQGMMYRDRWQQVTDVWNALREPHNPTQRVYESVEQMVAELEHTDINYLSDMYLRMVEDSSPALDGVTDEQIEELKKACLTIDWSVLSGRAWWHLKAFLSSLTPEQLQVKLPGSLSTQNLTPTNESSEPTLDVDQS